MNRSALAFWLLPLALLLVGCPSSKNQQAGQATKPPATSAATPAVASSPGATYRVYRGRVAGQPDSLTLQLTVVRRTRPDPNSEFIDAVDASYYGGDGEPRDLYQLRQPPADSLVLGEELHAVRDADGAPTQARWLLRRLPDGSLSGTRAGQALTLRPAQPRVDLAVQVLADSIAAFPKRKKTPYAHLSLQTLVPTNAALAANILRVQRGDTLSNQLPTPTVASVWQRSRTAFTKEYREGVADIADGAGNQSASFMLRWESSQKATVFYQAGNLLSLAFSSYDYSGGAHGNYGTTVGSFDLRTSQPLFFQDIFRPGAETQLIPLLDRAVRRTLGIQPTESLDTQLFDPKMRLTRNVCLTSGGALFVYQPYEIASYAQGEIRVFVPLRELRPLLREGLPLPNGAGVATR